MREEVLGNQPAPLTDQTVHYLDASGQKIAVARYPVDESFLLLRAIWRWGGMGRFMPCCPEEGF